MNDYRYKLEKGSKKHLCPNCGKKSYVRYIDTQDGNYLPDQYGRCDHESHCGYFLNPYKNGYKTNEPEILPYKALPKTPPRAICFLPEGILNVTLKNYHKNIFIQNLLKLAPVQDIEKVISLYRIGTIGKGSRIGAVTFPFIDRTGNIREIQIKNFDETNHTKGKPTTISYLLKSHYSEQGVALPAWLQDFTKNEKQFSCLFGEHLLNKFPLNPIALVEAPKTAIIGTLYYGLPNSPTNLLWLAVYNKSSLTYEKCSALKGRKVVLFPDLNAYDEWNKKSGVLFAKLPNTQFIVSDILEKNATENDKNDALDLADYLTRFDYNQFKSKITVPDFEKVVSTNPPSAKESLPLPGSKQIGTNEKSENCESVKQSFLRELQNKNHLYPLKSQLPSWSPELQSLQSFFSSIQLPPTPFRLDQCTIIHNLPKFISNHLSFLQNNNGSPVFLPYMKRLQKLRFIIESSI